MTARPHPPRGKPGNFNLRPSILCCHRAGVHSVPAAADPTAQQRVFLILDRHPVHRSATVQRRVEQQAGRLGVFFLPPDCPELNPDDYLNNDMYAHGVGRARPADRTEMIDRLRASLRIKQDRPVLIQAFFDPPAVRCAAA